MDTAGGEPRALTPENVLGAAVSPDGRSVAAAGDHGTVFVYPVAGGEPRAIPGPAEAGEIIGWTADSSSLYVAEEERTRARVFKRDVATGKRELWREIQPVDTTGLVDTIRPLITPDGRVYAYTCHRWEGTLYLVEGLK